MIIPDQREISYLAIQFQRTKCPEYDILGILGSTMEQDGVLEILSCWWGCCGFQRMLDLGRVCLSLGYSYCLQYGVICRYLLSCMWRLCTVVRDTNISQWFLVTNSYITMTSHEFTKGLVSSWTFSQDRTLKSFSGTFPDSSLSWWFRTSSEVTEFLISTSSAECTAWWWWLYLYKYLVIRTDSEFHSSFMLQLFCEKSLLSSFSLHLISFQIICELHNTATPTYYTTYFLSFIYCPIHKVVF